ncbi:MAG: glycerophosphodiester phosphodiesterase [Bdellovibrionales bacterium]|nr:glycerophosphodiester phosphodiesterase [Bdellovibrionales bacterium]
MSSASFDQFLQNRLDDFFSLWPQPTPSITRLRNCRLVAHRGQHDNFNVLENTLPAFETCVRNQIWGIELDLRWTEDLEPIILHDPDCGRVFGRPNIVPSRLSFRLLKQQAPFIPSLAEVVDEFGLQLHLMIELKESLSDPDNRKVRRLTEILQKLRPAEDYHFMSFSSEILKRVDFVPSTTCLGIAEWNVQEMSAECLKRSFGGITGHYLLLNQKVVERHHQANQKVGAGFIASRLSLWRELNRGVDWIFTNNSLQTKQWLETEMRLQKTSQGM